MRLGLGLGFPTWSGISPRTGLFAWYRNNGTDTSGNGRNLSLAPGSNPATTTTGIGGAANAAMSLDTLSSFLLNSAVITAGSFTYAGWLKTNLTDSTSDLIRQLDINGVVQQSLYQSGDVGLAFSLNGDVTILSNVAPSGTFQHAVGTYDGKTLAIYVNGLLVNSSTSPGVPYRSPITTEFGGPGDTTFIAQFIGIWGRALTLAEVVRLYNGGAGYDPTV